MAEENMSPNKMLESLKKENFQNLELHINNLEQIWNLVGIDQEQQVSRANQAWTLIINLSNDLVKEERGFYEDIKERIKNYEEKIAELSKVLNISKIEVDGTLIEKEEILRQELDNLSKLKHKRIREFQELHSLELKFCKLLGMPNHSLSSTTGVPSEKDLFELNQQINMLKVEKEQRIKKFHSLRKELLAVWEITELGPETNIEEEILNNNECSSLTTDFLALLSESVEKTKKKKTDLERERQELIEKVTMLWDRLNIDKIERELFLSRCNDCRVSSLNAIKKEVSRCEEIKRQNLQQYIDGLKKELAELWEACLVSEAEKVFPDTDADELDENCLEAYDNIVARWKQYHRDVEHIVDKIKKRQNLWELMIVFENKANDPNRFKNRRGNLLQEERERKKLQKDLPTLENEIFEEIEAYELEHGKPFLYLGVDFRAYINKQWDERNQQKENEKALRQKIRTKQLENEITLGVTPAKRQFPTTPKSAPSKLFKSNLGMPVFRTPNHTATKSSPKSLAKLKTNRNTPSKMGVAGSGKKVLQEKNAIATAGSSKELEDTTYSHFAAKLNRSSRKVHRSSVLSSRKVVGTRTSNSSRKKSGIKSSKKSTSRKLCTSKNLVTPARGKLGIPFLI